MIKQEFLREREDGNRLVRIYSDRFMMIKKVGTDELYEEAVDIENVPYTYTETDEPIVEDNFTAQDALNVILGVTEDESESN